MDGREPCGDTGQNKHPSAQQALFPSSRDGDILIKDKKQLMECGVSQQG